MKRGGVHCALGSVAVWPVAARVMQATKFELAGTAARVGDRPTLEMV
jgi:hypothetical protein